MNFDFNFISLSKEPSALNKIVPIDTLQGLVEQSWTWVNTNLLVFEVGIQLIAIMAAIVPAAIFSPQLRTLLNAKITALMPAGKLRSLVQALSTIALPIALYLSLTAIRIIFSSADFPTGWIGAVLALMNAWIVVRVITLVIQSPFWSKVAFYIAWPVAALDAFGALAPVVEQLQTLGVPLGTDAEGEPVHISLLDIIRTLVYFATLFWLANLLSKVAEQQLDRVDELSPALKALICKLLNVILPVIAFLLALQITGFNLATLAVFSGAVGLGVGLGLQRTVANFVAGFTLIADKSIKPRDTIEIDGVMGWVTAMQSRYVALRTRDGTELLIPNDRFMSEGVINWSRSDPVVRQHAGFGVAYGTRDLKVVQALAIEAAKQVARVVKSPEPICNLVEFGDSSINFDLCFWISDPQNGIANIRSLVLLELWEALHQHEIEIPFPQRDLHIKSWAQPPEMTEFIKTGSTKAKPI